MRYIDADFVVLGGAAVVSLAVWWLLGRPAALGVFLFYGLIACLVIVLGWRWVRRSQRPRL
jgi:membrane protein implicated in regulation of membrane protease activity